VSKKIGLWGGLAPCDVLWCSVVWYGVGWCGAVRCVVNAQRACSLRWSMQIPLKERVTLAERAEMIQASKYGTRVNPASQTRGCVPLPSALSHVYLACLPRMFTSHVYLACLPCMFTCRKSSDACEALLVKRCNVDGTSVSVQAQSRMPQ
jgi:hypothetical protein